MPRLRALSQPSVELKQAFLKTVLSFRRSGPILLGVFMLLALVGALIPKGLYGRLFTGDHIIDPLVGTTVGSILSGNPLTSYLVGGELKLQGISMVAITAFIVSWVTVGVVQLPAEALMLGRRFALIRNAISFLMSIGIAVLTMWTLGWSS